jgi:cation:H+ antiporter
MLPILLLLVGFVCLILAADFLVEGSAALARRMRVSDIVIGLTVVAFGTSTPELFVNLAAALESKMDIAFGNIVGSSIANILLILGVSALVSPLATTRGTVWKEIPFSLLAAVVLGIVANDRLLNFANPILSRGDGLIFLCFFIIFLYYSASLAFDVKNIEQHVKDKKLSKAAALTRAAAGFAGLAFGGWLIVNNAVLIAKSIGMSEAVIGLTIVAIGTSLPELATSAMAAYKGNADIAIGNIVGSNIFNIFLILGITSVVRPIPYHENSNIDLILLIGASVLLFLFMFTGKKRSLDRWEGALFFIIYISFVWFKVAELYR